MAHSGIGRVAVADAGFVHIHVHSSFSLLEGALPIARLAELTKADRQPALALTDSGNLFGALEFSEKMAAAGIQPIVGCALAVDFADEPQGKNGGSHRPQRPQRIVLIAANEAGYRNLMALVSRSFLEVAESEAPHVRLDWLAERNEGLLALSGGPEGPIDGVIAAGRPELALARLDRLASIYANRLYVELQRHGLESERLAEPVLIDLAFGKGLPLVAANEPYFAARD
ncbi:MAG: PHP domain-containing protein, partial [Xanthobacteraceae bacterium]|nr:PHP domain-containing protein [Xanthobacteraceae bacterium]